MKLIKPTLAILLALVSVLSFGQNYTSISDGNWANAANWNTGTIPPLNQTWGAITMQNDLIISSDYTFGGSTFNIVSGNTLTISANLTVKGGATMNVYGTLLLLGNAQLSANLRVHPGGKVIVEGSVSVKSSTYLTVGTGNTSPPFSDMIIYQNLVQQTSGDVTINSNGRLAVFGNVSDSGGGGTFIRVNDGGQVYVHGDINYSGGGSSIENNNSSDPYGLYVNGTTTNSGGGSSTTSNQGDQSTMQSTNPDFFNWVASQDGSPLPVVLIFFKAKFQSHKSVELIWATASEHNNDYFSIERSKNAIDFDILAQVKGNGTIHTQSEYNFSDLNPLPGISYYRLSQTDFDGTTEVFSSICVKTSDFNMANIYPNPILDRTLYIRANNRSLITSLDLNIFDLKGHLVYSEELQLNEYGAIDTKINLPNHIEKGTYVLRLLSENYTETQKIFLE